MLSNSSSLCGGARRFPHDQPSRRRRPGVWVFFGAFTLVGCADWFGLADRSLRSDLDAAVADSSRPDSAAAEATTPWREDTARSQDAADDQTIGRVAETEVTKPIEDVHVAPEEETVRDSRVEPADTDAEPPVGNPDPDADTGTPERVGGSVLQARAPSCEESPACGSSGEGSVYCCESRWVPPTIYRTESSFPRTVRLSGFYLDRFEVTVGRFRRFLAANGSDYTPPVGSGAHVSGINWSADLGPVPLDFFECEHATWHPTVGAGNTEQRAMNCVSWYQAYAFCIWDGGRLPTQWELQLAATGGADRDYPWFDAEPPSCERSNFLINLDESGIPCHNGPDVVGVRPEGNSLWQHADLTGNVREWVLDYEGGLDLTECNDCAKTTGTDWRVVMGGGWQSPIGDLSVKRRLAMTPGERDAQTGFRCVRNAD